MEKFLQTECVSYEQAKKLKELGYNGSYSLGYYENGIVKYNDAHHTNESIQDSDFEDVVAPTFQQAFRWIREKYGKHHIHLMNVYYMEKQNDYETSERKSLDILLNNLINKS